MGRDDVAVPGPSAIPPEPATRDAGGLAGKVVLVTGGSSGIGRAASLGFARRGCRVAVHYWKGGDRAAAVVTRIRDAGGEAGALQADLRSPAEARSLVDAVQGRFGRLDVLVNNAGDPTRRVPFLEVDQALWDESLALNLSGPFWLTQAAVPLLAKTKGVVLFVSTALTRRVATSLFSHYTAAKGGVNALTLALAGELSPLGIRVNCLCPGVVDTELQRRLSSPERLREVAGRTLVGRLGTPAEIAEILVFLASDAAAYMQGQIVVADGG